MSILSQPIPQHLYKYYAFDTKYNEDRLSGKVYLSNPFAFNDPSDCRLGVHNNFHELNRDEHWLAQKLKEIGVDSTLYLDKIMANDTEAVNIVWKKQLEKVGILCLSQAPSNKLLWGYYTNNTGFCIELDTNLIINRLLVAYINDLDFETTYDFFHDKRYCEAPYSRNLVKTDDEIAKASDLVKGISLSRVQNPYLLSLLKEPCNEQNVRCFMANCLLKRFGCKEVQYAPVGNLTQANLFYNNRDDDMVAKYYQKTEEWALEREFRIVASLGGNMVADLGTDIIKSVRLGCNISTTNMFVILSILYAHGMTNIPIYKMRVDQTDHVLRECPLDTARLFALIQQYNMLINV